MADRWWNAQAWDDTGSVDGTHTCAVCDHAATIQTPQRRTRHYCTECDAWRVFESVHSDPKP